MKNKAGEFRKKLFDPTNEQMDATFKEIGDIVKSHLEAARKVTFLQREDVFIDRDGNIFQLENGKMWPINE